jgi:Ca-activated chloride channel family protein
MIRALALALCLAAPARACETALVLAIDISGSINPAEYALQVRGLVHGLSDPEVIQALIRGQVALTVVEWSGVGQQAVAIPWARMVVVEDVARFRDRAARLPRAFRAGDTAVGDAIAFSAAQFADVADCTRRVIDISGDGSENAGGTVVEARSAAERAGITINAIAIEDPGLSRPITNFYLNWAITRDGFVITARGLSDYPRSMREKLLRELVKPSG